MRSQIRSKENLPVVKTKYISFDGGLNLVDGPLDVPDGMVLGSQNYELRVRGGYRRIHGHERFDGQGSPSDAAYWIIDFDAGVTLVSAGDTVTGLTSGASGVALVDGVLESGAYNGTGAGYLVLGRLSGNPFTNNEDLQVSAATVCDADGIEQLNNATTDALNDTYTEAAIEDLRDQIGKVGAADGSGAVLGVHQYNFNTYAFRDNAAGTACLMYKATATGWVLQALGNRIPFTDGGAGVAYVEGEVVTGTTSGAFATITRVVQTNSLFDWGFAGNVGFLYVGTVTAGPFQAEATTGDIAGAIPIDSAEIANTLLPAGKFEFDNYNFFATSGTFRMYGVDGVNPAFEWDGTVFVFIFTGNTNDTPAHLSAHKYHLFLCFEKGSLQNSTTGTPYSWVGNGAVETGTGDILVGIIREIGNALAVICRNRTFILFGSNATADPWDLKTISEESGGIEWTLQRIGETRYLDDRGFTKLEAVQAFGDFKGGVYSQVIEPLLEAQKTLVTTSLISKTKNQYRVFFSDNTAIYVTFDDNKVKGFMTQSFTDGAGAALSVQCAANGEDSAGNEVSYFGADDGYVYQLDKGSSFDGTKIEAFIVLSFMHFKSPEHIKEFLKAVFDVSASKTVSLYMTPDFDYSEREDIQQIVTALSGGGRWNVANWNEFLWSSPGVGNPEVYIQGSGKNIGMLIYSEDTYEAPHTLHGMTMHYQLRRRSR